VALLAVTVALTIRDTDAAATMVSRRRRQPRPGPASPGTDEDRPGVAAASPPRSSR
jgi:hypothetical protein